MKIEIEEAYLIRLKELKDELKDFKNGGEPLLFESKVNYLLGYLEALDTYLDN